MTTRRTFLAALVGGGISLSARNAAAQTPQSSHGTGSSAVASPESTAYPPIEEVRDLWVRPWAYEDDPFEVTGVVVEIMVAEEGYVFPLGVDEDDTALYRAWVELRIELPNGRERRLAIGAWDDVVGVYPGDTVTVGGVVAGEHSGVRESGKEVTMPLIAADYVRPEADSATPAA